MHAPLTVRGLLAWLVVLPMLAFAAGFVGPIVSSPFLLPHAMIGSVLGGILIGALGFRWLCQRERPFHMRLMLAPFAYLIVPIASFFGVATLIQSPLQPIGYGVRRFDEQRWKHPSASRDFDRSRSQMTAHLLLGGLLENKTTEQVRHILGAPDCGLEGQGDAWYMGLASSPIDADCLHVWYGRDGRVTAAHAITH